jgi:hypothetical protein
LVFIFTDEGCEMNAFKKRMAGMMLVTFLSPTMTGCASTGQSGGSFISDHPVATGLVVGAVALAGLGALALHSMPTALGHQIANAGAIAGS